jgi:hypothetical protein
MEHTDQTGDEGLWSNDQSSGWMAEDTIYALAMHIDLNWKELNILSQCACAFPNVPKTRCLVCERSYEL